MIVNCPSCSARFRLDRQRLAGKRVTLRCPRCREAFRTEIPASVSSVPSASAPGRLSVLVAHGDPQLRTSIGEILARDGIDAVPCADGMAALSRISEEPLPVAIIDVALPGLLAFELVERIRQQPHLAQVKIILIPSVYRKTAYKRTPSSLYGADDYIEQHHLAEDLVAKIHSLLAGLQAAAGHTAGKTEEQLAAVPVRPGAEALDFMERTNARIKEVEEQATICADGDAVAQARRLARIIVSDIVLYNETRVVEGVRSGNFMELFAEEIKEGQNLFCSRIPQEIRATENFLQDAFTAFIKRRHRELNMEAAG